MKIYPRKTFYLKGEPEIGEVVKVNDRKYTLVDFKPRTTRHGQRSFIFTLTGHCTICGDEFEFECSRVFWPTATCKTCR